MGRLKAPPPLVARLPSLLPEATADRPDAIRDRTQHWRKWYRTARWARIRWAQLTADMFTCRMCGRLEGDTSKLVADHIKPHDGDPHRFWDPANIQTLCQTCHSKLKQAEEEAARRGPTR